jgi:hypothetical protein
MRWKTYKYATGSLLGLGAACHCIVSFEGGGASKNAEIANFRFGVKCFEMRGAWVAIVIQKIFGW